MAYVLASPAPWHEGPGLPGYDATLAPATRRTRWTAGCEIPATW